MDSRDQLPYTGIVHQPDSEPPESGGSHTKQTKTNLSHNRADFRIENQKRKERESQELDENSKSTLECFSSWCQELKEWRRWSSYGNPCKELAIHLHWHRRDPIKGPITPHSKQTQNRFFFFSFISSTAKLRPRRNSESSRKGFPSRVSLGETS